MPFVEPKFDLNDLGPVEVRSRGNINVLVAEGRKPEGFSEEDLRDAFLYEIYAFGLSEHAQMCGPIEFRWETIERAIGTDLVGIETRYHLRATFQERPDDNQEKGD